MTIADILIVIFVVLLSLIFIAGGLYQYGKGKDGRHPDDGSGLSAIIAGIVFLVVVGYMSGGEIAYKQGQIHAINGEIHFELVKQPNGEMHFERIEEPETKEILPTTRPE